jgi:hypothetical protein
MCSRWRELACRGVRTGQLRRRVRGSDPGGPFRRGLGCRAYLERADRVHPGETEERGSDYFGPIVNQAAPIMDAAYGGPVVLSNAVRDAANASVTDLGTHELHDIDHLVHFSQLGAVAFAPLATGAARIVSLPSPRTSLVGREDTVNKIGNRPCAHRLVTFTGVGGCGKACLSIEMAHGEAPDHPECVWFVDLPTIADGVAPTGAFAATLHLEVRVASEPVEQLVEDLASPQVLLLVDNYEHVIDSAAELIDTVFERCPDAWVLALSRA